MEKQEAPWGVRCAGMKRKCKGPACEGTVLSICDTVHPNMSARWRSLRFLLYSGLIDGKIIYNADL